jgi:hypothetical protein
MRKLVLILIAFIAVVTFIRAYDHRGGVMQSAETGSASEIIVNIDSK